MNTQLNWQPSDGGERAEANGFSYLIEESPVQGKPPSTLFIDVSGTNGADRTHSRGFFGMTKHKEMAQSFANAVALSSKASTIDVEACAKEAVGVVYDCQPRWDGSVARVANVIRKHLQPASESAWISVEEGNNLFCLARQMQAYLNDAIYDIERGSDSDSLIDLRLKEIKRFEIELEKFKHFLQLPQPPARKS